MKDEERARISDLVRAELDVPDGFLSGKEMILCERAAHRATYLVLPEGSRVCGPDEVAVKREDVAREMTCGDGTHRWCIRCKVRTDHCYPLTHYPDCWYDAAIGDSHD